MITLIQKQEIIMAALNGKSQRAIAREFRIGRNTIRRYMKQYYDSREKLLASGTKPEDVPLLIQQVVEKPKYDTSSRTKTKLTNEVMQKIQMYLNQNQEKREHGMHKQQMKAIDIYEALKEEKIDISYTTVCKGVRLLTKQSKEAYIKQDYKLGDVCEFDWGEVKLYINSDKPTVYQLAVFTTAKGNFRYARLFRSQKTECFLEAHSLFFDYIGGAYKTMTYDNMKIAVKRFVSRTEKEATDELLKLSLYYGFQYRFCNIRSGNEKGHVERSVEYIRRKTFSRKDTFSSLDEANEYLLKRLEELNALPKEGYDGESPYDVLVAEKPFLLPKMPKYHSSRITEARVDKYATISVDQNRYSVPDYLVGQFVTVIIYTDQIECFHDNKKVATHLKKYGNHEWSLCISHYTKTLSRKPGALRQSLALKQSDQRLQKIYNSYYTENPKDFIALLEYISEVGEEKVYNAIHTLQKLSPMDLSTDKIKLICERNTAAQENCSGDPKIIDISNENIKRINEIFGIQSTHYQKEAIL